MRGLCKPCCNVRFKLLYGAINTISLLVLVFVLAGCASTRRTESSSNNHLRLISQALRAYHAENHDYPNRLDQLHPRYLTAAVPPLHDEKYPESLKALWVDFQNIDPELMPNYQRVDKDFYICYERIDQDNYSIIYPYLLYVRPPYEEWY